MILKLILIALPVLILCGCKSIPHPDTTPIPRSNELRI